MEMSFATGRMVMNAVERLIKKIHRFCDQKCLNSVSVGSIPLDDAFFQMPYHHAMSKHGSDKPDLRISGLVSSDASSPRSNG